MSSYWLTDPELFLFANQGTGPDDVHLLRCKKPASSSSSLVVVPMKPDDFEYVETVTDYLKLLANMIEWDEPDYNRLVKFIYERRLLVNIQGLVIAEIYKLDDANEVPIYIRSLDVLPLKPYIPNLMERPIPSRTVKYLGDVNGKAAMISMEEKDSNVTLLTARVADLESKNKTLDTIVTKLTARVADLESKNKTPETNVTKLTARVADYEEGWMNGLTNSEWVGLEGYILNPTVYKSVIVIKSPGTFTTNDNTTNVQKRYWHTVQISNTGITNHSAVCLEDLTPNKEKARFSKKHWPWAMKHQGKIYIVGLVEYSFY